MKFSILIPHYRTGMMTAFCMNQIDKFKGNHEVEIIVINNSPNDPEGFAYIQKELDRDKTTPIVVIDYPTHRLEQSHGLAFDYALQNLGERITDYFITLETDSFPTNDTWLDYYEDLINRGMDMAGSMMKLSGGTFVHPTGGMYRKDLWKRCKLEYVQALTDVYDYYPNMQHKDGFPCHMMVQRLPYEDLTLWPDLHHSYKNHPPDFHLERYRVFSESVFHNGMGFNDESFLTYGIRNFDTGIQDNQRPAELPRKIHRIGYEPGQFFAYWHAAQGLKIFEIPTEIQWMPNRENQQQEFTLMENGVKHLWGVTAYRDNDPNGHRDIIERKRQQVEELYASLSYD